MTPAARSSFLALGLVFVSTSCLQLDQTLPLDLEDGQVASRSIGSEGGVVSVPPDFSMVVPAGALASSATITVQRRLSSPFPSDAGSVLPGTSFDVSPVGLTLAKPAVVELRVPESLLSAGEDVKLGVAVLGSDGAVTTSPGAYDATVGLLSASIDRLGTVAAVIELDAIDVETGLPPALGGGNFGGTSSGVEGMDGSASLGVRFASTCTPSGRRCFSSGLVRAWMSANLTDRLGTGLAIVSPSLVADLDFSSFDSSGQPTSVVGSITVTGSLKARVGQAVTSYELDERRFTGSGGSPNQTGVTVSENLMVFDEIAGGPNRDIEFGLTRIATGKLLTVRLEEEIELENDDGSKTVGIVVLHVRLRR
ncbi:MAG: hypothetical protein HN899_04040 [Gemmatimonadales bacterium]|nr:hypothetical protein [Gemmatimonadales bacterium]MBT6696563.1 hypothetical protein [Gemmatimonadales bacterium]MBT7124312.1 hypothetical protein [Gemmatimonadales bacterium]